MKIAITTEDTKVHQHFGNCKTFTVFEVDGGMVIEKSTLDTTDSGHELLVKLLKQNKINVLICGGIGGTAKNALRVNRIEIIPGVLGSVNDVIIKYLSGEIIGNPDFVCSHNENSGEGCHC